MKKSDSTSENKALKEELKHLKKENAQLKSKNKKSEAKIAKQESKLKEKDKQLKKKDVPKRLGIPADHQWHPVNHGDVTILHMEASRFHVRVVIMSSTTRGTLSHLRRYL